MEVKILEGDHPLTVSADGTFCRSTSAEIEMWGRLKELEAFQKSVCVMLGWMNIPPQRVIEMELNALKARAASSEKG